MICLSSGNNINVEKNSDNMMIEQPDLTNCDNKLKNETTNVRYIPLLLPSVKYTRQLLY